jgi:hypothetical protein
VDHILWNCNETEAERHRANLQNNIFDKAEDGIKELIEYVKKISFYTKGYNMKKQNKNSSNKKI